MTQLYACQQNMILYNKSVQRKATTRITGTYQGYKDRLVQPKILTLPLYHELGLPFLLY